MNQGEDQFQPHGGESVGDRLRSAREAQGRELEEIATITRVPLRHLRMIEAGDHADLPATPYSVGFVRTYAQAIGLDGQALARDFRAELGAAPVVRGIPEPFEPADPKRVPTKLLAAVALLIAILIAVAYAVVRSGAPSGDDAETRARLAAGTEPAGPAATGAPTPAAAPVATPAPATGPVVVTATEPVWLRIYEGGGGPRYIEKVMQPGDTFEVPATAKDPQILTGRPQAIRVTVGRTVIPPLGTPERTIADVSLKADALLARGAAAPVTTPAAVPSPAGAPAASPAP